MQASDFYSLKIGMAIFHDGVNKTVWLLSGQGKRVGLKLIDKCEVYSWLDISKDCHRLLRDDYEG